MEQDVTQTWDPSTGHSFHLVAPDLRAPLAEFPQIPFGDEYLSILRERSPEPLLPDPAPRVSEQTIPGPADNPHLRVLIVDPKPGASDRPALLHMHGGGYVLGSPDLSAPVLQRYAQEAGCVIVSVNYRLAPETRFPGSLEDNFAALCWLYDNTDKLGVDPTRIGVGGESAGGGHAAALAIATRDRQGPPVCFQFLVYPMLDDRTGSAREMSPYVGEYVWTAAHNRWGWSSLLGLPAGSTDVPDGAVPSRAVDLSGLPPAFIAVGALDIFVEENSDYASRLVAAGVPADLYLQSGAFHGFISVAPAAESSKRFKARLYDALQRGLNVGPI